MSMFVWRSSSATTREKNSARLVFTDRFAWSTDPSPIDLAAHRLLLSFLDSARQNRLEPRIEAKKVTGCRFSENRCGREACDGGITESSKGEGRISLRDGGATASSIRGEGFAQCANFQRNFRRNQGDTFPLGSKGGNIFCRWPRSECTNTHLCFGKFRKRCGFILCSSCSE